MEVAMSKPICGTLVFGCTAVVLGLTGCSRPAGDAPSTQAAPGAIAGKKKDQVAAQAVSRKRLHRPFKQAVLLDPPVDFLQRPPDHTVAGKNVARIFEAIAGKGGEGGLWDQVEFCDTMGRSLTYTAILKTELGEIHIALLPEAAPNHVTNFIALARAGYYDGLPFHTSHRVEIGEKPAAYLETGCPLGSSDPAYGSVGYWLEPELGSGLLHQAGTVGAWHVAGEPDTAACRFYITLRPAPWMDGAYTIFGKVTRGLEVAEAINRRPVIEEDPFDRPKQPVVIQEVIIRSKSGAEAGP
jgi:cyclophilin family peptidyl-prolyl cis-trans isomerase